MDNTIRLNEIAWDKRVDDKRIWTIPVTEEEIEKARNGIIEVSLGGQNLMPVSWLPQNIKDKKILCLASGGGQQAPIFASAGADVTVVDISEKQLLQDRFVAEKKI